MPTRPPPFPPDSVDRRLQQANAHHAAGQWQEAERLYREILHAYPDHPDANHNLGVLAAGLGKPELGLPHFKLALDLQPAVGQYWLSYAEALLLTGQRKEALSVLEQGRQKGLAGTAVDGLLARIEEALQAPPPVPAVAHLNREQRRAAKAQDKREPAFGTGNGGGFTARKSASASATVSNLFAQAHQHYHAGRLHEAEALIRQILTVDAVHADSVHLLGLIAYQRGQVGLAIETIRQAISLDDQVAAFHYSLGNVLADQDKLDEAMACYQRALTVAPAHFGALYNLARALHMQGSLDAAVACYEKALTVKPGFAELLTHLGSALGALRRFDEAIVRFEQALAAKPADAEALYGLANARYKQGQLTPATKAVLYALRGSDSQEIRALFCLCLSQVNLDSLGREELAEVRRFAERALTECWARPLDLARPGLALIRRNDALRDFIARSNRESPERLREPAGSAFWRSFAADRLLISLLKTSVVPSVEFERFLTSARDAMLACADEAPPSVEQGFLGACCALAQQCFINEYVFALAPGEAERVQRWRDELSATMEAGAPVPILPLVVVAAYFPLHQLPKAEALSRADLPPELRALLRQQLTEPDQEARLRETIPGLTPIADGISTSVREQYEQNPYPRWVNVPPDAAEVSIDAFLHRRFPLVSFDSLGKPGAPDILIAGCGTGQHSIDTAQRFPASPILAIDLSLTSLCYAKRKTREMGLGNIEYAQADIVQLHDFAERFDVIESVGVLHHLADPLLGWRNLLSLLRPRGFMFLGFYSELARQDVVAARAFIAERGYQRSADDIRQCRQDLIAASGMASPRNGVLERGDFFAISACRDLLFHVQEHRLNLPEISAFLADNKLDFIGFHTDSNTLRMYRAMFPEDIAMTDLGLWHQFETAYPATFAGMYQFWVQKRA